MISALLILHLLVGGIIVACGTYLGRRALYPAVIPFVATLIWLLSQWGTALKDPIVETVTWVPALGLSFDFRMDGFGALMVSLVSGIGLLVLIYSRSYFAQDAPGVGRLIGLLVVFAGAMFGLVTADNLFLLYGCWELTSITSYFLIGNKYTESTSRAAALQALLITGAGGLVMLLGLIMIGQAGGTYSMSELLANPPSGTAVTWALVFILIGAITKSAQYPFQSWLPGAMVAPTPVSAYLHSATMVKAGVYIVARFSPAFGDVGFWRPTVVGVGLISMVLSGLRAMRQQDLKLLLAFGTVSQLGLLFVLFGLGTPESITAGCVMLLAHAIFKAALFMSVGILDVQLGTRDIRLLPRIGTKWPVFFAVVAAGSASMAGIPVTFGFVAKEFDYEAVLSSGYTYSTLLIAAVVVASMFTFAYSLRYFWGAIFAFGRTDAEEPAPDKRPTVLFVLAPLILTVMTLVLGFVPGLLDAIMTAASQSLSLDVPAAHLSLWHGINEALLLSAITVAGGLTLFKWRRPISRVLAVGAAFPTGGDVYRRSLRAMNRSADIVTSIVQNGSLPVYIGVILVTSTVAPAIAFFMRFDGEFTFDVSGSATTVIAAGVLGALAACSAIAAATVQRRFAAALMLAGVGYSMAGFFVLQGAPDLALTQAAIETLFTVIFVLVLRRLPDKFERTSVPFARVFRGLVASTVAIVVFICALAMTQERMPRTVSDEIIAASYPEGHGRNVVNVILVDFRGLDTLGEITVLVAAAIGAVALARAVDRPGAMPKSPTADASLDRELMPSPAHQATHGSSSSSSDQEPT